MREPTQSNLRKRLIALEGDDTQVAAAAKIYTPYRSYKSWRSGQAPIRGLLRAYIEAQEELRRAWAEIDRIHDELSRRPKRHLFR